MGNFVSTGIRWRDADVITVSPDNESAFDTLMTVCGKILPLHPSEANTPFSKPVSFTSHLHPDAYATSRDFIVDRAPERTVVRGQGFTLEPVMDGSLYMAKVTTLNALKRHLLIADSNQFAELRHLFQENPGFVNMTLGIAPEISSHQLLFEASRAMGAGEMSSDAFAVALLYNKLGNEMLSAVVEGMREASDARGLQLGGFDDEVGLLRRLGGSHHSAPLRNLEYDVTHAFEGGARCPPWRQIQGDVAYVVVDSVDVGRIVLTCSRKGVFRNHGYVTDSSSGASTLDYSPTDPSVDPFPTIAGALRTMSPHFAENIDNKPPAGASGADNPLKSSLAGSRTSRSHRPSTSASHGGASTSGHANAGRDPVAAVSGAGNVISFADAERSGRVQAQARTDSGVGRRGVTLKTRGAGGRGAGNGPGASGPMFYSSAQGPSRKWKTLADGEGRGGSSPPVPPSSSSHRASPRASRSKARDDSSLPPSMRGSGSRASMGKVGAGNSSGPPRTSSRVSVSRASGAGSVTPRRRGRFNDWATDSSTDEDELSEEEDYFGPLLLSTSPLTGSVASGSGAGSKDDGDSKRKDFEDHTLGSLPDGSNPTDAPHGVGNDVWQIQKLVKFIRPGNQAAVVIALSSLLDFDLSRQDSQVAIRDAGGVEPLVGLLSSGDLKVVSGALQVLREISRHPDVAADIAALNVAPRLVGLVKHKTEEIRVLATDTLASCGHHPSLRRSVRRCDGIRHLVEMLAMPRGRGVGVGSETLNRSGSVATAPSGSSNPCRVAAAALSTLARSRRNAEEMVARGAIPHLVKLVELPSPRLLIAVIGVISRLSVIPSHRKILGESSVVVKNVVARLSSSSSTPLQTQCALAISHLAQDVGPCDVVRRSGGMPPLVAMLDSPHPEAVLAATRALWHVAKDTGSVKKLDALGAIPKLVGLLNTGGSDLGDSTAVSAAAGGASDSQTDLLIAATGAIKNCCEASDVARSAVRGCDGIPKLVRMLTSPAAGLVVNVCGALGGCARDPANLRLVNHLDGVRLLWSLLKSPDSRVQAAAAWAICPCIQNADDAGALVRSFIGGLELIVKLLKSPDLEVQAAVCAAIAMVAKDEENLAVITDHGVVYLLSKLSHTKNDHLRTHLADAIACCCAWGNNRVSFGHAGAVAPLVKYLKSPDAGVHSATAHALFELSFDPGNCRVMHHSGVVPLLLGMVGSVDHKLQEAAAGALRNIRVTL